MDGNARWKNVGRYSLLWCFIPGGIIYVATLRRLKDNGLKCLSSFGMKVGLNTVGD